MYISLPSDASMDLFPENTMSSFKVKLPNTITLDRTKHVVGLTSIEFPHSFKNITNVYFKIYMTPVVVNDERGLYRYETGLYRFPAVQRFSIRSGYYRNPQELVTEINDQIRQVVFPEDGTVLNGNQDCYFEYDERTEKLSFLTTEESQMLFRIHMHWELYCKLGFALVKSASPVVKSGDQAQYVVDLGVGLSTIYMYCNIMESSRIVGSMYAPLLRVLPVEGQHGDVCHFEPKHMEYFPLRYDQISEISIQLCNDNAELLEFQSGKTVVGLHIKTDLFQH